MECPLIFSVAPERVWMAVMSFPSISLRLFGLRRSVAGGLLSGQGLDNVFASPTGGKTAIRLNLVSSAAFVISPLSLRTSM